MLRTEEGATNQGIQAATRSWKSQGNRFSPSEPTKGMSPINSVISAQ
jgi:hypothetical protein